MKFTKRQKIIGTVGLVIIALVIGTNIYIRQERIETALEFGHLAKLPYNSSGVKVDTKGGMFSRTFWLIYVSTPTEIKKWIKESKELKRKEKKIPVDSDFKILKRDPVTGELKEIAIPKRREWLPDWFSPDETSNEVDTYEVSIPDEALHGTVWVDWGENKVYIETSYS